MRPILNGEPRSPPSTLIYKLKDCQSVPPPLTFVINGQNFTLKVNSMADYRSCSSFRLALHAWSTVCDPRRGLRSFVALRGFFCGHGQSAWLPLIRLMRVHLYVVQGEDYMWYSQADPHDCIIGV
eukprot:39480-Eustigmatos_ZCMA.PRE.1